MDFSIETPADRLIVAADFAPDKVSGIAGVRSKVMDLAAKLEGTGVCIKINSILRACGYSLIKDFQDLGLKVMADLKLVDIPATMKIDGELLALNSPDLLTVMANSSIAGMSAIKQVLPKTEILAVTILTSLDEEECQQIYDCSIRAGVVRFARMAHTAGCQGLVCSGKEVKVIKDRKDISLFLNTPGIRPKWAIVGDDDQKRVTTPADAIANGVDRIIIGRPITQADSPNDAVKRTLDEIQQAVEDEARKYNKSLKKK
jgi:orotidine-5'-phosphate decarboxylase